MIQYSNKLIRILKNFSIWHHDNKFYSTCLVDTLITIPRSYLYCAVHGIHTRMVTYYNLLFYVDFCLELLVEGVIVGAFAGEVPTDTVSFCGGLELMISVVKANLG